MPLEDIPKLGETLSLPGSSKKHEVALIHKKVGVKHAFGTHLKAVEVELRKPEKC